MDAVGKWLDLNKTPGRKVNQIDNRGSNFYVALYWAEEMAAKDQAWAPLAQALKDNEEQILKVCLPNVLMITGIQSNLQQSILRNIPANRKKTCLKIVKSVNNN